ncbi:hypothetical protein [Vibrio sp. MED222]|uniref:hypothetical protein n=1 Tax=Vibrio sp. MED222 TaxID=314290 RepID=UPI000068C390|nr:hypothetical protein [Vibrio sp. MED222]EAQ52321.1 hypothetical protein MED222_16611 [Vibrio sp. MED222]
MVRRKNYKIRETEVLLPIKVYSYRDSSLVFETNKGKVDFNRWNYFDRPPSDRCENHLWANRERLVLDLYNALTQLRFEMSPNTIEALASETCKQLFQYLDYKANQKTYIISVDSFNRDVIDDLLIWLRNKPARTDTGKLSKPSARKHYNGVKTILSYFIRQNRISPEAFPYAPFINVNRSSQGASAYSKSEMSKIMRYLWKQRDLIRRCEFKGSQRQELAVYALIIAAKTGRNTSTILNLKSDCISEHPLAPDTHVILTGFKKRGMNTSVQAMRGSINMIDTFSANKDIGSLVLEVVNLTKETQREEQSGSLFVYTNEKNQLTSLSESMFWKCVQALYKKANLSSDNGQPLRFQIKRMRKTFAERVWQLTGGDPVKTAKTLGNTAPILDRHYLDVTPQMVKQHKLFGHVLTESLLHKEGDLELKLARKLDVSEDKVKQLLIGNFNTKVARCSDPKNGKFAKGGVACSRFMKCFICPNQVVLESDLYRLFSFYWLVLDENEYIGRRKWKALYNNIIRIIDTDICKQFDESFVNAAKERARKSPHPAWCSRTLLEV